MGLTLKCDIVSNERSCRYCKHLAIRAVNPETGLIYSLCEYELATGQGCNNWHRDGVCQKFESITLEDIAELWFDSKTCAYETFIFNSKRIANNIIADNIISQKDIIRIISEKIKMEANSNE